MWKISKTLHVIYVIRRKSIMIKRKLFSVVLACALCVTALTGCGNKEEKATPAPTTKATEAPAEDTSSEETSEETSEATSEESSEESSEATYVDGFYANNGEGTDFMIAFYETDNGDLCYLNNGESELIAEYTVENAETDNGTAYLLVTVTAADGASTQLGYYETDEGEIFIVDETGDIFAGGRLSEEEADEIYNAVVNG